jgi:hypothetical protein
LHVPVAVFIAWNLAGDDISALNRGDKKWKKQEKGEEKRK